MLSHFIQVYFDWDFVWFVVLDFVRICRLLSITKGGFGHVYFHSVTWFVFASESVAIRIDPIRLRGLSTGIKGLRQC